MAEQLVVNKNLTKIEIYEELIPQLKALTQHENDRIANMANVCAGLKEAFNFFWVGFYLFKENQLVLGPFQGPVACTRIAKGKGVCGTAWEKMDIIIVPDVNQFPGHIACSAQSKSEIVLPIVYKGEFIGVLDIDSNTIKDFDSDDANYLSKLISEINWGE